MIILSRRDMSAAYSTMFYCTVARSECWHVAEVVGYCSLVLAVNHSFFDDIKYLVTCMRHRRRIPDVIARALYHQQQHPKYQRRYSSSCRHAHIASVYTAVSCV